MRIQATKFTALLVASGFLLTSTAGNRPWEMVSPPLATTMPNAAWALRLSQEEAKPRASALREEAPVEAKGTLSELEKALRAGDFQAAASVVRDRFTQLIAASQAPPTGALSQPLILTPSLAAAGLEEGPGEEELELRLLDLAAGDSENEIHVYDGKKWRTRKGNLNKAMGGGNPQQGAQKSEPVLQVLEGYEKGDVYALDLEVMQEVLEGTGYHGVFRGPAGTVFIAKELWRQVSSGMLRIAFMRDNFRQLEEWAVGRLTPPEGTAPEGEDETAPEADAGAASEGDAGQEPTTEGSEAGEPTVVEQAGEGTAPEESADEQLAEKPTGDEPITGEFADQELVDTEASSAPPVATEPTAAEVTAPPLAAATTTAPVTAKSAASLPESDPEALKQTLGRGASQAFDSILGPDQTATQFSATDDTFVEVGLDATSSPQTARFVLIPIEPGAFSLAPDPNQMGDRVRRSRRYKVTIAAEKVGERMKENPAIHRLQTLIAKDKGRLDPPPGEAVQRQEVRQRAAEEMLEATIALLEDPDAKSLTAEQRLDQVQQQDRSQIQARAAAREAVKKLAQQQTEQAIPLERARRILLSAAKKEKVPLEATRRAFEHLLPSFEDWPPGRFKIEARLEQLEEMNKVMNLRAYLTDLNSLLEGLWQWTLFVQLGDVSPAALQAVYYDAFRVALLEQARQLREELASGESLDRLGGRILATGMRTAHLEHEALFTEFMFRGADALVPNGRIGNRFNGIIGTVYFNLTPGQPSWDFHPGGYGSMRSSAWSADYALFNPHEMKQRVEERQPPLVAWAHPSITGAPNISQTLGFFSDEYQFHTLFPEIPCCLLTATTDGSLRLYAPRSDSVSDREAWNQALLQVAREEVRFSRLWDAILAANIASLPERLHVGDRVGIELSTVVRQQRSYIRGNAENLAQLLERPVERIFGADTAKRLMDEARQQFQKEFKDIKSPRPIRMHAMDMLRLIQRVLMYLTERQLESLVEQVFTPLHVEGLTEPVPSPADSLRGGLEPVSPEKLLEDLGQLAEQALVKGYLLPNQVSYNDSEDRVGVDVSNTEGAGFPVLLFDFDEDTYMPMVPTPGALNEASPVPTRYTAEVGRKQADELLAAQNPAFKDLVEMDDSIRGRVEQGTVSLGELQEWLVEFLQKLQAALEYPGTEGRTPHERVEALKAEQAAKADAIDQTVEAVGEMVDRRYAFINEIEEARQTLRTSTEGDQVSVGAVRGTIGLLSDGAAAWPRVQVGIELELETLPEDGTVELSDWQQKLASLRSMVRRAGLFNLLGRVSPDVLQAVYYDAIRIALLQKVPSELRPDMPQTELEDALKEATDLMRAVRTVETEAARTAQMQETARPAPAGQRFANHLFGGIGILLIGEDGQLWLIPGGDGLSHGPHFSTRYNPRVIAQWTRPGDRAVLLYASYTETPNPDQLTQFIIEDLFYLMLVLPEGTEVLMGNATVDRKFRLHRPVALGGDLEVWKQSYHLAVDHFEATEKFHERVRQQANTKLPAGARKGGRRLVPGSPEYGQAERIHIATVLTRYGDTKEGTLMTELRRSNPDVADQAMQDIASRFQEELALFASLAPLRADRYEAPDRGTGLRWNRNYRKAQQIRPSVVTQTTEIAKEWLTAPLVESGRLVTPVHIEGLTAPSAPATSAAGPAGVRTEPADLQAQAEPIIEELLSRTRKHRGKFPSEDETRKFLETWVPQRLKAGERTRFSDLNSVWRRHRSIEQSAQKTLSGSETSLDAAAAQLGDPQETAQALVQMDRRIGEVLQNLDETSPLRKQLEALRTRVQRVQQVPQVLAEVRELTVLVTHDDLDSVREVLAKADQALASLNVEQDVAWRDPVEAATAELAENFGARVIEQVEGADTRDQTAQQLLGDTTDVLSNFPEIVTELQRFDQLRRMSPQQIRAQRLLQEPQFEQVRQERSNRHMLDLLRAVVAGEPYERAGQIQRSAQSLVGRGGSQAEREFYKEVSDLALFAQRKRGGGRGGQQAGLEEIDQLADEILATLRGIEEGRIELHRGVDFAGEPFDVGSYMDRDKIMEILRWLNRFIGIDIAVAAWNDFKREEAFGDRNNFIVGILTLMGHGEFSNILSIAERHKADGNFSEEFLRIVFYINADLFAEILQLTSHYENLSIWWRLRGLLRNEEPVLEDVFIEHQAPLLPPESPAAGLEEQGPPPGELAELFDDIAVRVLELEALYLDFNKKGKADKAGVVDPQKWENRWTPGFLVVAFENLKMAQTAAIDHENSPVGMDLLKRARGTLWDILSTAEVAESDVVRQDKLGVYVDPLHEMLSEFLERFGQDEELAVPEQESAQEILDRLDRLERVAGLDYQEIIELLLALEARYLPSDAEIAEEKLVTLYVPRPKGVPRKERRIPHVQYHQIFPGEQKVDWNQVALKRVGKTVAEIQATVFRSESNQEPFFSIQKERETAQPNFSITGWFVARSAEGSVTAGLEERQRSAQDPMTFEELLHPDQPLRPSFHLLMKHGQKPFYEPQTPMPPGTLEAMTAYPKGWLSGKEVDEQTVVRALVAIERAKRRVAFHDKLDSLEIPAFMGDGEFMRIGPSTKVLEVAIDSGSFLIFVSRSDMEGLMTSAVGHEFGHLAVKNGYIQVRADAGSVEAPENVRQLMPAQFLRIGRAEILPDLLARALSGDEAYQSFLLAHVRGVLVGLIEGLQSEPGVSGKAALNLLTYFLVLAESLPDTGETKEMKSALKFHLEQMGDAADISLGDRNALRDYYANVLRSHVLQEGVVLESATAGLEERGEDLLNRAARAVEEGQPGMLVMGSEAFDAHAGLEEFVRMVPPELARRMVFYAVGAQRAAKLKGLNANVTVIEQQNLVDLLTFLMSQERATQVTVLASLLLARQLEQILPPSMEVISLEGGVALRFILAALGVPVAQLDQMDLDLLEEAIRQAA